MKERTIISVLTLLIATVLLSFLLFQVAGGITEVSEEHPDLSIPNSLSECFEQLSLFLTSEDIEELRNSEFEELYQYHFGLGLWIRNNWIYPAPDSRLMKMFFSAGFRHPDSISSFIVEAYHYYLNNEDAVEVYEQKLRDARYDYLIYRVFLLFALIITVASIRFFLRNLPRPIRLLKKTKAVLFLRGSFALCISSILFSGVELFLYSDFWFNLVFDAWIDLTELTNVVILSFNFTLTALFLFVDMTKKQIAISAIIPTAYYVCYTLALAFFPQCIYYGILGLGRRGWSFIFHTGYITMLRTLTGSSYSAAFPNVLFAFFPFAYVMVARRKNDLNASKHCCETEVPAMLLNLTV